MTGSDNKPSLGDKAEALSRTTSGRLHGFACISGGYQKSFQRKKSTSTSPVWHETPGRLQEASSSIPSTGCATITVTSTITREPFLCPHLEKKPSCPLY